MLHKLFNLKNSHLIFDLFLENKINSFYAPHILNNQTNVSFSPSFALSSTFKTLYIVKDIPDYLNLEFQKLNNNTDFKKVNQYKGYLVNLIECDSTEAFIAKNLNKRNRKNLYSKKRKLYKNHKISSQIFFGSISKSVYDNIFETLYTLLKNRFKEKKIHNRYLSNWKALQASTFQKILDKQVSLHIIYDDSKPIVITLNFHKGDVVFSHIQAYDVNYSRYNLGDISMMNHLEWLINNNIAVFDLSMGKTYYKEKWCNHTYTFIYHIFYNKKALLSKVCANIIVNELKFIQFLRNKSIIGKLINFDKFLYYYKSNVSKE
ncbi:GNAT family N-acetyltransferase [Flavivirga rizhaonensis]|uniref:GNAT family N-acetyltransferase n=1 Tax=Flavivirga rizhaonensis TaxID=2559571 RepID=A0A4S1DZY0_9FLAO|nr:GNAT family N-acetyltransferase [Flavivirga rizhaonensis]TGV03941.1 GNAT family N-acetyltransferase [Flavivirga rizhaonensis]